MYINLDFKLKSSESNELFKTKMESLSENGKTLAQFLIHKFDMKYPLSVFKKDTNDFRSFEDIKYTIENYFIGRNILIEAISDYYSED